MFLDASAMEEKDRREINGARSDGKKWCHRERKHYDIFRYKETKFDRFELMTEEEKVWFEHKVARRNIT